MVMVKHFEPLREEDDSGYIVQIWWRITLVYVAEAEEATVTNGLANEEATHHLSLGCIIYG